MLEEWKNEQMNKKTTLIDLTFLGLYLQNNEL